MGYYSNFRRLGGLQIITGLTLLISLCSKITNYGNNILKHHIK